MKKRILARRNPKPGPKPGPKLGPVLGHDAPGPRLTQAGAALLALAVALPGGALLGLADWLF